MLIPPGIGSYKRADLPQVILRNLYIEKTPLKPTETVFLPRAALTPYQMVGAGPSRGIFQKQGLAGGATFAVSGGALYNGASSIGTISGTVSVAMAAALNVVLIANGTGLYTSDGATVTPVAFPDGAGVVDVAYIGGYSIAARAGSRHIYFTLDPSTWDGLDFISAEQGTDNLVGFSIVAGQLWVFCENHTEIFATTGDADAPLQAVEGRVFDKGALTRDSIINLDNTVFWVGNDGIVYRGAGAPQRVSDHGIEERIASSAASEINAWTFPWIGHVFYALHTADGTLAYDVATQQWCELASYGRSKWRARQGQLIGRDVIAGDDETGQLWKLTDGVYQDDDAPIQREFTCIINDNGFIDNITLDCSTGQRPTPNDAPGLLEMRTSRDGGMTWRDWRDCGLGAQGKYRTRAGFNRVGLVDQGNMTIQFRLTDPVPSSVRYIKINESGAGRSR